ncbi:MAG: hypothetical protein EPN88_04630 [Bacteroidetes bacterium]|nr:MAG: hypothetical protein EPN88_04630 [Bacteroidota bacterium]
MKRLIRTIRLPLIVEIANSILIQLFGKSSILLYFSWAVTVSVIFWGGFLVIKEKWGTLLRATCVGPVILILGFMLIGGLYNAITGDFTQVMKSVKIDMNPRLVYLVGVVISTLMFLPLAGLISLLGAVIGRKSGTEKGEA